MVLLGRWFKCACFITKNGPLYDLYQPWNLRRKFLNFMCPSAHWARGTLYWSTGSIELNALPSGQNSKRASPKGDSWFGSCRKFRTWPRSRRCRPCCSCWTSSSPQTFPRTPAGFGPSFKSFFKAETIICQVAADWQISLQRWKIEPKWP